MNRPAPDKLVFDDNWSDLSQFRPLPKIDHNRLYAYPCLVHGVGMCDDYPRINPIFRGQNPYDDTLDAGMVLCIESIVGAVGEPDGVKVEQQVLVTNDGYEVLTNYPMDESLLD